MHLWSRLDDLVPLDLTPNHERVHRPLDVVGSGFLALGDQEFKFKFKFLTRDPSEF